MCEKDTNELIETTLSNKEVLEENDINLVDKFIQEEDPEKQKQIINLFNLNQQRKQALQVTTISKIKDNILDQMTKRVVNKADEFSNDELLKYFEAISTAEDKLSKSINQVNENSTIRYQQNNQVNINMNGGGQLNQESREKVADAVKAIFSRFQNSNENLLEEEVIDEHEGC